MVPPAGRRFPWHVLSLHVFSKVNGILQIKVKAGLGIDENTKIEAQLYKLLIYPPGWLIGSHAPSRYFMIMITLQFDVWFLWAWMGRRPFQQTS
jgi:hypothetical protein